LKFGGHIIVQRQIQLSMEGTEECKGRDERAIRGLIDVLTEDPGMDPFVAAIPGSFTTKWGVGVWKGLSKVIKDASKRRAMAETYPWVCRDYDAARILRRR